MSKLKAPNTYYFAVCLPAKNALIELAHFNDADACMRIEISPFVKSFYLMISFLLSISSVRMLLYSMWQRAFFRWLPSRSAPRLKPRRHNPMRLFLQKPSPRLRARSGKHTKRRVLRGNRSFQIVSPWRRGSAPCGFGAVAHAVTLWASPKRCRARARQASRHTVTARINPPRCGTPARISAAALTRGNWSRYGQNLETIMGGCRTPCPRCLVDRIGRDPGCA